MRPFDVLCMTNAKRQKLWSGEDESLPAYLSTVSSDYRDILAPFLCFLVSHESRGWAWGGGCAGRRAKREIGMAMRKYAKHVRSPFGMWLA